MKRGLAPVGKARERQWRGTRKMGDGTQRQYLEDPSFGLSFNHAAILVSVGTFSSLGRFHLKK